MNENIDAEIQGIETEFSWVPIENLRLDAFVSWLDTEITEGESVNPADPTNSNPDWLLVKNTGADVFIAPVGGQGFDPADCDVTLSCATLFAGLPHDGTGTPLAPGDPARQLVQVPIGIPQDVKGNELPNAPEFSVKLGAQYSFFLDNGWEVTPRVDYYWQDDFYYRIYNTRQDEIDSWSRADASVSLAGRNARWHVEAYVKNIGDKDYITGGYFTDYSSANFTNVFLLAPRTWGIKFGMRFGEG